MEHRFNLASDPWIPVYNKNLDQKLVSLRDLLAHSDIYRIDLSDIALMRFIAAAHWTVRYREGAGLPIGKRLPAAWVDDYLDRWHDRFDLEADPTPRATKTGRQTIVETAESAADAALRLIQLRFKPFGLHAMTCDGPLFPMFDDLDVPAIANDRPVWERTGLEGDAPTGPLDVLTWESRRITVSRTKTGQYLLLERADRRPEPTGPSLGVRPDARARRGRAALPRAEPRGQAARIPDSAYAHPLRRDRPPVRPPPRRRRDHHRVRRRLERGCGAEDHDRRRAGGAPVHRRTDPHGRTYRQPDVRQMHQGGVVESRQTPVRSEPQRGSPHGGARPLRPVAPAVAQPHAHATVAARRARQVPSRPSRRESRARGRRHGPPRVRLDGRRGALASGTGP